MLNRIFRQTGVPEEYRSNFLHLYLDVAWVGVLNGSTISFLSIYATRLGATSFQVGLLGALSAFVTLFLAIPAGSWLKTQQMSRAVFVTAAMSRAGYLPLVFLPWLIPEHAQIVAILVITFLMAIPLTPVGIGFNALFAEAVPSEYRAHVAGIRNAMLAITFMFTSLLSGYILDTVPFPAGYQIVFAIGVLGAAMSSLHLKFVRPITAIPGTVPVGEKNGPSRKFLSAVRIDIWKTPFRSVLLVLFAFHLAQFLPVALFPIYNVRVLELTDDQLGIGTALFYLMVLLGSIQIRKLVQRFGNQNITGWSILGIGLYPLFLSLSHTPLHFYGVSLIGGLAFAFLSGSFANYMLEHIPADDRPSYLAWYTLILNAAILLGSLLGPLIAETIGLAEALVLIAILRMLSAVLILRRR
ncbi:MAG TPA: MFS transporter [Anaerolineales bacterium]|nr:MFS transporter [Anaerolineales bacterium]